MKVSAVVFGLTAALAPVSAMSVWNGRAPEMLGNDDNKVPGESPLELCPGDHDKDLVQIESVDLSPNPPKAYVRPQDSRRFIQR